MIMEPVLAKVFVAGRVFVMLTGGRAVAPSCNNSVRTSVPPLTPPAVNVKELEAKAPPVASAPYESGGVRDVTPPLLASVAIRFAVGAEPLLASAMETV